MWPLLSREDLRAAKNAPEFTSILPILIRRLILETAEGIGSIDMPGGSGISSPGFDGMVHSSQQSPFIPKGWSVWEFSVSGGNSKADLDYSKRQDLPSGLSTLEVTYVQVILEPWTKARDWEAEKTHEGIWKEVRAYNIDRIDAWLEQAPSTTIWLASQLGKAAPGVQSLQSWWQDSWLASTSTPLDERIVLAGREDAAQQLTSSLIDGQAMISLGGDLRIEEAYAFLAAALQSADAGHSQLTSRAIFISDYSNLESLLRNHRSLILLVDGHDVFSTFPESRHQIIRVSIPGIRSDITVPRIDDQSVRDILETNGMQSHEAAQLSALGRRSISALRRSLAIKPELYIPRWATKPDPILRRLLLLNSWSETNKSDQELIAHYTDLSSQDLRSFLERLTVSDDVPFLGRLEEAFYVIAQEDAWTLIEHQLTDEDLEKFCYLAFKVLSEVDPFVELDQGERLLAQFEGTRRRYSDRLRRGIATTLALLGSRDVTVTDNGTFNAQNYANKAIKRILQWANQNENFRHWFSLTDVLKEIAEAAPEGFLKAIRTAIENNESPQKTLFRPKRQQAISFGPTSPHINLLWALETTAWFPDHIDDAVDTIAILAGMDPGEQDTNRPIDSLVRILNPIHPNTSASFDDRIRCLRFVVSEHREAGEQLLVRILPTRHTFTLVKSGPRFSQPQREPSTYKMMFELWDTVLALLIEKYGLRPELMTAAIKKIDDFSEYQRARLLSHLGTLHEKLNEVTRTEIYYELRNVLARHQEFQDSDWALPKDALNEIHEVCQRLAPTTPSLRYRWLFDQGMFSLGDPSLLGDYKSREKELHRRRTEALSMIIAEEGFQALLDLAISSGWPEVIGVTLAQLSSAYDTTMLAQLASTVETKQKMASAYLSVRLSTDNKLRDDLLREAPNSRIQAKVLLLTGDAESSRDVLAELDPTVAEFYWQQFPVYGIGAEAGESSQVASELIRFGRPVAAVQFIKTYDDGVEMARETAEVIAMAFESIIENKTVDSEFETFHSYELTELLEQLAAHHDYLGEKRLALLEWNLSPISEWEASMPTFHKILMRDPGLFVKLIAWAYLPDSEKSSVGVEEQEVPSAEVAMRANEVLRGCKSIPGTLDDQDIDYEHLFEWISQARRLLSEMDRLRIGDAIIGDLLANSLEGTDGAPLHEAIRELIQTLRSEKIEEGIYLGIINSRGVTSRGIYDGGDQERELAQIYNRHATTTRPWPRVRKIMQKVASHYEHEATREDLSAEHRRRDVW